MTKEEFLKIAGITEEQFYGKEPIKGSLDLSNVKSIPGSFNPTVGGDLWLDSLTSIPDTFNPIVGWCLDLRSLTSIPPTFNPTVGWCLDLNSLTTLPPTFNPTVGGNLNLSSLTSIPEGFNPTIGESLNLTNVKTLPPTFNPTVGGALWLNSLTSIPSTFNPTVGGNLWLPEHIEQPNYNKIDYNHLFTWQNGRYIKIGNQFSEVVHKRNDIYKLKYIGKDHTYYVIYNDSKYCYGSSLIEAKVNYKLKTNKTYIIGDKLNISDAIVCYKLITKECSFTSEDFIKYHKKHKPKYYTIEDIAFITEGEYNNDVFKEYYNL